ncbi:MAG TPA: DUF4173 domain-containing protein [Anaerolineales bacterium]|nr:DUF4173 domain-containing protein [Anaerolineales bacterium]
MKNKPNRFWLLVILLGWAFDFLFWEKPAGVNFILWVALCLATGIYLLQTDGLRLSRRGGLLLLPILFLSLMAFLRREPLTVFLSISMTLFLMGVFALTYLGGNWTRYRILDYIIGYATLFGSMIARPLGFAAEVKRDQPSLSAKRGSAILPIVRGIVIALPVIAIFGALLSSADLVFAKRFEEFIDLFNIENLPEYIFRLVYILIFAYIIAGVFLRAAQKSDDQVGEKNLIPPFLGFTESVIVLGSLTILFAAFVAIQFQYFFGGQANINIEGYTYSEYARRGFGELVAVAFFSLLILLGLGSITKREIETQRRIFSGFGIVLVGLVIVMQVSAFQRLVLYENAYGFSRLRAYTHVFMLWLAVLLIAVAALELLKKERAIGFAMILALMGFIASLALLNVDAFIVRQNIQREVRGVAEEDLSERQRVELDTQYFLNLSDDAVPDMAAGFQNDSLPVSARERIGAALACRWHDRNNEDEAIPWQGFNLSTYTADRVFVEIKSELTAYTVADFDSPPIVTTPGGEEISCWGYTSD